jgi:hypothetical protein
MAAKNARIFLNMVISNQRVEGLSRAAARCKAMPDTLTGERCAGLTTSAAVTAPAQVQYSSETLYRRFWFPHWLI